MHRLLFAIATLALLTPPAKAAPLQELKLDYATYSPASLVIRKFGWLEEEFKGTPVKWVFSQGSNRALEYLNSGAIDIGSTAGLPAVLARANGNPIKTVYLYSQPEWVALVVPKESPIKSLADLKGKKIAATKGTEPYLFVLRALRSVGLTHSDVELVHLQHADGRLALEQGRVDAWGGLDPHMAASELTAGSRLLYRNIDFNTRGFLDVREEFLAQHPDELRRVLRVYERARHYLLEHPAESAQLLADEAKVTLAVAQRQLERTHFDSPQPSSAQVATLQAAAPILLEEGLVKPGTDLNRVITELVDLDFAGAVIAHR